MICPVCRHRISVSLLEGERHTVRVLRMWVNLTKGLFASVIYRCGTRLQVPNK